MDVKILENLLQVTIDRGNLRNGHHQNVQNRIVIVLELLKSDAAEFVDKVKDPMRKRQKRMSNIADSGEEHSIIWGISWLRR